MAGIWLASWAGQAVTGRVAYDAEQSEFLAVGSMAVLSIYLRQRGSPE